MTDPAQPASPHQSTPTRTRPDEQALLLLRVEDAAARLSLSRATVSRLLATGALPSVKLGRARRVVARDLEQFVEDLATGRLHLPELTGPGGSR